MACREQGYDDQRFVGEINDNLRCAICLGVVKHPVMCQQNEHLFCRCCIEQHLQHFHTCPTCMDNLTMEILKPVPRMARQMLDNLMIRCDNVGHGCREVVKLEELPRHVQNCWFSPIECSNQGCNEVILRGNKTMHENEACRFRENPFQHVSKIKEELGLLNVKLEELRIKVVTDDVKKEIAEMKQNQEQMRDVIGKMEVSQAEAREELRILSQDVQDMKKSQARILDKIENTFTKLTEQITMPGIVQRTEQGENVGEEKGGEVMSGWEESRQEQSGWEQSGWEQNAWEQNVGAGKKGGEDTSGWEESRLEQSTWDRRGRAWKQRKQKQRRPNKRRAAVSRAKESRTK